MHHGRGFLILAQGDATPPGKTARAKRQEQAVAELRASFIAHAERIARTGILTGDQDERLMKILEQK